MFSISFTVVVVIVAVKYIRLKLKWIAYVSNQLGLQIFCFIHIKSIIKST